jgi:hypothetical protein
MMQLRMMILVAELMQTDVGKQMTMLLQLLLLLLLPWTQKSMSILMR